jgi:sugar/nucleoside kinase (ribokinase family)
VTGLNRESIRSHLNKEGIRTDAYTFDGGHPNEQFVLERRSTGWAVYYSERGYETALEYFATEDEACRHLLRMLLKDGAAE